MFKSTKVTSRAAHGWERVLDRATSKSGITRYSIPGIHAAGRDGVCLGSKLSDDTAWSVFYVYPGNNISE